MYYVVHICDFGMLRVKTVSYDCYDCLLCILRLLRMVHGWCYRTATLPYRGCQPLKRSAKSWSLMPSGRAPPSAFGWPATRPPPSRSPSCRTVSRWPTSPPRGSAPTFCGHTSTTPSPTQSSSMAAPRQMWAIRNDYWLVSNYRDIFPTKFTILGVWNWYKQCILWKKQYCLSKLLEKWSRHIELCSKHIHSCDLLCYLIIMQWNKLW